MKPLTVAVLRKLSFKQSIHLNRGREHDTTSWNEEYKLLHSVTASRPQGWKIIAKTLSTAITPHVANLLVASTEEYDRELERFVAAYNEALGKCEANQP
jgi:hypothetical protein